jgi:predicted nucleic acid-binding protein
VRIVLDTCILVSAFRSRKGASNAVLATAVNGRFETLISVPLVLEYEAVLSRSEHLLESKLSAEDVEELIDDICSFGVEVYMRWNWRPKRPIPTMNWCWKRQSTEERPPL